MDLFLGKHGELEDIEADLLQRAQSYSAALKQQVEDREANIVQLEAKVEDLARENANRAVQIARLLADKAAMTDAVSAAPSVALRMLCIAVCLLLGVLALLGGPIALLLTIDVQLAAAAQAVISDAPVAILASAATAAAGVTLVLGAILLLRMQHRQTEHRLLQALAAGVADPDVFERLAREGGFTPPKLWQLSRPAAVSGRAKVSEAEPSLSQPMPMPMPMPPMPPMPLPQSLPQGPSASGGQQAARGGSGGNGNGVNLASAPDLSRQGTSPTKTIPTTPPLKSACSSSNLGKQGSRRSSARAVGFSLPPSSPRASGEGQEEGPLVV